MAERKAALTYIGEITGVRNVAEYTRKHIRTASRFVKPAVVTLGIVLGGSAAKDYFENKQSIYNSTDSRVQTAVLFQQNHELQKASEGQNAATDGQIQEVDKIIDLEALKNYQASAEEHKSVVDTLSYMLNSQNPDYVNSANNFNQSSEIGQNIARITPPGFLGQPVTVGRILGIDERVFIDGMTFTKIPLEERASKIAQAEQLVEQLKKYYGNDQAERQALEYFAYEQQLASKSSAK